MSKCDIMKRENVFAVNNTHGSALVPIRKGAIYMMNYIKRSLVLLLLTVFPLLGFTACSDEGVSSAVSISPDGSYVGVNYTDTGDTNNSAQSIGHVVSESVSHSVLSEISADINKVQSDEIVYSESSVSSSISSSAVSSSQKQNTATKTIITYYFTNENDDDVPDTESEVQSQAEHPETDSENTDSSSDIFKDSDSNFSLSDTDDTVLLSDTDTTEDTDSSQSVMSGEFTADDLVITINDVPVTLGTDIALVDETIGEPLSIDDTVSETDSSVIIKKMFNFESLCIETVLSDDEAYYEIVGIQIFDDFISTDKGLHIGMTAEEATAIYGESMMVYDDYYRYYIDNKYMYLYITNGLVANIGYSIDKEVQTDD